MAMPAVSSSFMVWKAFKNDVVHTDKIIRLISEFRLRLGAFRNILPNRFSKKESNIVVEIIPIVITAEVKTHLLRQHIAG